MQGVGNDFVVLEASSRPPQADWAVLAQTICDRHCGVGADGLLVVEQSSGEAAFSMRMFNPDGTEDMCGNGLRCVALWAWRSGWVTADIPFSVATKEGMKTLRILSVSEEGRAATVQVDMGQPNFAAPDIPICGSRDSMIEYPLTVGGSVYPITAMNTGSTHTVIFGPAPDEQTFQHISPLIEQHPLFPERTSVLWATPQPDESLAVRIWERGVGETWGCGTGACAVGVAAKLQHLVAADNGVSVVSRGGILKIDWSGEGSPVFMTGPAEFVFDGFTRRSCLDAQAISML